MYPRHTAVATAYVNLYFRFFLISDAAQDVEEKLNLWELSDEERVDFICTLQYKIVREFSKAVTLYEEVSIIDYSTRVIL